MNKLIKTSIASILITNMLSIAHADDGTSTELDAIEVISQKFKEKDEAYKKTGAVSIRDEINKSSKDLDAIIRSTPGTFTQMNKAAGAVSVNIRGATGLGRVNTMIDGVTQTFYSSGGDTGTKGGGAGSQFGAAIDPLFLTSVEINRGSFKSSSNGNALMGSANFKTIGVDDVLRLDKNIGGIIKYSNGDNDLKPEYMAAVAGKRIFDYGGSLGFLYGYSRKTITQDYLVGGGETHQEISKKNTEIISEEYRKAYDDEPPYDIRPFDPEKVKQKPQSHLVKLEYVDDYSTLGLQYRKLTNHLAGRSIKSDTKQINYNLIIPNNDFINLNLLYSQNKNSQNYDIGSTIIDRKIQKPLQGRNKSISFDINNSFKFNLPFETNFTMTSGMNWLKNDYSRNRYPDELRIFKVCEDDPECVTSLGELNPKGKTNLYTKVNASLPTNSFFPQGDQKNRTIYFNNKFEWKMFTLDYNVNLVKSKNKGQILTSVDQEYHKIQSKMDRLYDMYDDLSPTEQAKEFAQKILNEANKLSKDLDAFDKKYEWDFDDEEFKKRPTFVNYKQVKNTFKNYSVTLTANMNNYFTPFISYSKTHRAPTVQEMFFSSLADAGVNLNLKPETARTQQIGFNGFMEGAITDADKIGYKVTAYKTRIDDFIHNVYSYKSIRGINPIHGSQIVPALQHRNHDQLVTMKGFEAEFSYDMGRFFANLSYARQRTNQPASYSDIPRTASNADEEQAEAQSFGLTKVTILPNSYGSLELGTRLFDNKVTIGAIAKYYGKSKRTKFDSIEVCRGGGRVYFDKVRNRPVCPGKKDISDRIGGIAEYEEIDSQPMVYDFYVMYEPTENLMLKLNVDNITDVRYANPLDANNDSASQYSKLIHADKNAEGDYYYTKEFQNNFARGRTFKFSLSYKF
ncbi:hemoglobin/transferrin/lactoferrin receptor protein [Bisgaardia hudsonensis]|uniref:Hemoglobin/transferrin/lactoferrin receptor protein n=1 Tax=Bisgaardia hudsonensis TaxID=109472 RepID=A0A4R2MX16_9PAST|nr:TonB-dependent receptor [Bisgaardia hudsonensis]QLB12251.1 hypothetical protein A6A11_00770 [Bisgaardia hudsonensis]TCP12295.1 hemoglobin/transferrin/lactoferrin receptor protein [Bisgaardia hudsonensis]